MGKAFYSVSLAIVLAALWLTLSGRVSNVLLLSLGAVSIVVAIALSERFDVVDEEAAPFHRLGALIPYWGWLFVEIVKANLAVTRAVIGAHMDLTPRLVTVPSPAKTDFGRAVFANSITLTPGTVTVEAGRDEFLVHALLGSMTDPDGFAQMGAKAVRASEGTRKGGGRHNKGSQSEGHTP